MYCNEVLYKWNRPPSEKWCRFENILLSHAEGSSVVHSPYDISHIVR